MPVDNVCTRFSCSKKQIRPHRLRPTPSPSFYHFNFLPQEIRDHVWQYAIHTVGARTVNIRWTMDRIRAEHLRKRQIVSPCPIPGVLHACRDSRSLALRRWERSFAELDGNEPPKIYFDFATDVLYFDEDSRNVAKFMNRAVIVDKHRVERIAFHLQQQFQEGFYDSGGYLSSTLHGCFPNLTHLSLPAIDYNFNYELQMRGLPQPERCPKKTVISFYKTDLLYENFDTEEIETLEELEKDREGRDWLELEINSVNYLRTTPGLLEKEEHEFFDMISCDCEGPENMHTYCPDGESCRYCD